MHGSMQAFCRYGSPQLFNMDASDYRKKCFSVCSHFSSRKELLLLSNLGKEWVVRTMIDINVPDFNKNKFFAQDSSF
jgi:hypothetical protein